MWETVENVEQGPSAFPQLLWSLGLIPVPVGDHWSIVLDVLFCGVTLAGLCHLHRTNMPFWKIDKPVRRLMGPNPFRAHDTIGSRRAVRPVPRWRPGADAIPRPRHRVSHGRGLPPDAPRGRHRRVAPVRVERMEGPDGEQLYVNAEHDGTVGVVTLSRERTRGTWIAN